MSICEIARRYHHSRRKVREALDGPEPEAYRRSGEPAALKLGPNKTLVGEILAVDEAAPAKQRHLATQIHQRLIAKGYRGGYDQVRRYVGMRRRRKQETLVPLDHSVDVVILGKGIVPVSIANDTEVELAKHLRSGNQVQCPTPGASASRSTPPGWIRQGPSSASA
jgi:hypothetical protein